MAGKELSLVTSSCSADNDVFYTFGWFYLPYDTQQGDFQT
jgi:hypothetical protein